VSTTLFWAVRSYLVTLADSSSARGVVTFDGPLIRGSVPHSYIIIGSDGGEDGVGSGGLQDGGIANQVDHPIGNGARDETGEVICSFWSRSGGTDLAVPRAAVASMTSDFVAALNADRTLGGLLSTPGWYAALSSLRPREAQTDRGALAGEVLTVSYRALLI